MRTGLMIFTHINSDAEEGRMTNLTTAPPETDDPVFRKEPGEYMSSDQQAALRTSYKQKAKELFEKRFQQDSARARALRERFSSPILGRVRIYDALLRLSECIDITDTELFSTNQLIHSLQVAEGMERDGITDEGLILAALVHDLGKVAEFAGASPEDLNGPNQPLGDNPKGCGLDNALIMWNHDEFAYQRLKDYVPDYVGWLIRYHSLRFDFCSDIMDDRDRRYYDMYLHTFRKYDLHTKSTFYIPAKKLSAYQPLLDKYFLGEIVI